jgi:sortase (surface protein transpeptidase)
VRRGVTALVLAGLLAACGGGGGDDTAEASEAGAAGDAGESAVTTAPAPSTTAPAASSAAADAIQSLPVAPALPTVEAVGPAPVTLSVEALGISGAVVRPVGVEGDGEMEVPPADEVGWYRYGARPGDAGASVLAAHIAYNGVDGVFRHLEDLAVGDTVEVTFEDGAARSFVVDEMARYPKTELPAEMWSPAGDPRLALVTCGGEFDAAADSYEDNVVAWAVPA